MIKCFHSFVDVLLMAESPDVARLVQSPYIQISKVVAVADLQIIEELTVVLGGGLCSPCPLPVVSSFILIPGVGMIL